MSQKCSNCGFENIDESKFCRNCGAEIIEKGPIDSKNSNENWFSKQSTAVKATIGVFGICCIGVILIFAVGTLLPEGLDTDGVNFSSEGFTTDGWVSIIEFDYQGRQTVDNLVLKTEDGNFINIYKTPPTVGNAGSYHTLEDISMDSLSITYPAEYSVDLSSDWNPLAPYPWNPLPWESITKYSIPMNVGGLTIYKISGNSSDSNESSSDLTAEIRMPINNKKVNFHGFYAFKSENQIFYIYVDSRISNPDNIVKEILANN
ncbi:MAG: zinc-ribbon domain-containing protein [Methanobrevibacter sp.]|nr:zinc-ribbon domain-containing protein [Methanobrevibacter sp.]